MPTFDCVRMEDIEVDENGYIYFDWDFYRSSDRWYLNENLGFSHVMKSVNGGWLYYDTTPPAEVCKNQHILRVEENEIKIQSSALANQSIEIPLVNATAANLGVEYLDVMTHTYASKAITTINDAIAKVSEYRSMFGALQNRLEHAQANVDNTMENTQDAESKLRDTDMAEEMVNNSAASIISQAAQSMLAQSNEMTQGVLQLLK